VRKPRTFSGVITVASRIVDILSSGLYESPAACLKELLNNSYDADAQNVNVFVKPDADRIIIEDDGLGMSHDEFVNHFKRISESHKREHGSFTPSGRPMIGKIGIGAIAANEICDVMEIYSTKAGSPELLRVNIDFKRMRSDPIERRRTDGDIEKADYFGEILTTDVDSHYTHVFLTSVRGEAREILAGAGRPSASAATRSLYGLGPESIVERLSDPLLRSWSQFDLYSETLLRVALSVPVPYYSGWIAARLRRRVRRFEVETAALNFHVRYDGSPLGKPAVLRSGGKDAFINHFLYNGSAVAAKGYFYVQHGAVRPQDINGLLIRIRHAAVGGYDSTFLGFPSSEGALFQKWISAEVWADDRLEEALNIDRKTLRITHPAYVELQKAVHAHLSRLMKKTRSAIYQAGNVERKHVKAKATIRDLKELSQKQIAPVSKKAARELVKSWRGVNDDVRLERRLLRRFDVTELYRIVLEVAAEVISGKQLEQFIQKLTRRLTE
jgi:hypothetical protein